MESTNNDHNSSSALSLIGRASAERFQRVVQAWEREGTARAQHIRWVDTDESVDEAEEVDDVPRRRRSRRLRRRREVGLDGGHSSEHMDYGEDDDDSASDDASEDEERDSDRDWIVADDDDDDQVEVDDCTSHTGHQHQLSPLSTHVAPDSTVFSCSDIANLPSPRTRAQTRQRQLQAGQCRPALLCVVCETRSSNAAVVPCGHTSFCYACLARVHALKQPCPTCRGRITRVIRLHH